MPDGSFTLAAQRDFLEGGAGSIAALGQHQAPAFALERAAWARVGEFARP